MTRRDFLVGSAGVAALGAAAVSSASGGVRFVEEKPTIRPFRLKPGDKVALVAPAGAIGSEENLLAFEQEVRDMGLEPVRAPFCDRSYSFFGGTDEERASDIMWSFQNPDVSAIFPVRGGYGCTRILDRLDFGVIAKNPKAVCGYSDITGLIVPINEMTGMVTYHGPVLASGENQFSTDWFRQALMTENELIELTPPVGESEDFNLRTVAGGSATGSLTGGNLCVLAAMAGTPWQMNAAGKIVFLEDIGEAPYRIDRMLTQLMDACGLRQAAGIILGQFTNCDSKDPDSPFKVADVVQDRLAGLGIPVLAGTPIGHVKPKWTMPIGVRASLDATAGTVKLVDAPVS